MKGFDLGRTLAISAISFFAFFVIGKLIQPNPPTASPSSNRVTQGEPAKTRSPSKTPKRLSALSQTKSHEGEISRGLILPLERLKNGPYRATNSRGILNSKLCELLHIEADMIKELQSVIDEIVPRLQAQQLENLAIVEGDRDDISKISVEKFDGSALEKELKSSIDNLVGGEKGEVLWNLSGNLRENLLGSFGARKIEIEVSNFSEDGVDWIQVTTSVIGGSSIVLYRADGTGTSEVPYSQRHLISIADPPEEKKSKTKN